MKDVRPSFSETSCAHKISSNQKLWGARANLELSLFGTSITPLSELISNTVSFALTHVIAEPFVLTDSILSCIVIGVIKGLTPSWIKTILFVLPANSFAARNPL